MIRSKRELEAVAAQWTARAKEDLRNQMIAFIEANGTNEAELADALSISLNEIDQILNGNGEISLSTFAKLLIATDNVIEIKPAAVMRQQFGGRMPHAPQGGYPMPQGRTPQGRRPMPQRGDMPFPPMGEEMPQAPRFGGMPGMNKRMKKASQPNRLPNGRFAPKNQPQVQCVRLDELELDELGKNELLDIIRQNHWDSEIHAEAKRGELIEFLNWKIENQDASEMNEAPQDDENAKIARMLAEEVARNPHLKEMVKKYL